MHGGPHYALFSPHASEDLGLQGLVAMLHVSTSNYIQLPLYESKLDHPEPLAERTLVGDELGHTRERESEGN